MLFSSISFLYYFLPCMLAVYFLAPDKLKNPVLLISSLIFYGWSEPRFVILMAAMILAGYIACLVIEKYSKYKKMILILALLLNVGVLGYFKYADFFIENVNAVTGLSIPLLKIGLPIGISFYTFQIISYIVDVYRGEVKAQKNLLHLATYISMFPQLIAGPIVRYKDIEGQLISRKHTFDKAAIGIRRFLFGLSKKVLIANAFGELCEIFRQSGDKSVLFYWMYAVAFMLQIYFDFSGYSDMAIGLGKILGFDFMENFNYPYISKSITEFWRRWHISLGSWFRDYVYIPLGGSRVKSSRMIFNLLAVWILTGFWHGAAWNFVIWGLYFAVLLMLEKFVFAKIHLLPANSWGGKIAGHFYVILTVMVSFVIFNAPTMGIAIQDIAGLIGMQLGTGMNLTATGMIMGGIPLVSAEAIYYLKSYALLFGIAIIGATPLPNRIVSKVCEDAKQSKVVSALELPLLLVLMIMVTAYLVDGSFNPFLYFRF